MSKKILITLAFSAMIFYQTSLAFGDNPDVKELSIRTNHNNIYDSRNLPCEENSKTNFYFPREAVPSNRFDMPIPFPEENSRGFD